MNELVLFAGAGGGILGGKLLGWHTVCAVEIEPYCRNVLMQRQNDGILEPFPVWDDVRTFDATPWRGKVDVVSGGFPCQDISCAGKGAGLSGERSGLWKEFARIIGEVRPRYAFIENSPLLVSRGLDVVLCDLAKMGYDARWGVIGANDAGFPHSRKRLWIVANAVPERERGGERQAKAQSNVVGHSISQRLEGHAGNDPANNGQERQEPEQTRPACPPGLRSAGWMRVVFSADCDDDGFCPECGDDFSECGCPGPTQDEHDYIEVEGILYARARTQFVEPELDRVAHGVANRVDRINAIGNGQVPAVAALAWEILSQ